MLESFANFFFNNWQDLFPDNAADNPVQQREITPWQCRAAE